jgi:hypothetical protein
VRARGSGPILAFPAPLHVCAREAAAGWTGGPVDGGAVPALRGPPVGTASGADDVELAADLAANAAETNRPTCAWDFNPQAPGSDLCAEHAASEQAALAADPHEGLECSGPGFFERESLASPFDPPKPPRPVAPTVRVSAQLDGAGATRYGRVVLESIGQDLAEHVEAKGSRADAIYAVACRVGRLARGGHAADAVAFAELMAAALESMPDDRLGASDTAHRGWRAGRED